MTPQSPIVLNPSLGKMFEMQWNPLNISGFLPWESSRRQREEIIFSAISMSLQWSLTRIPPIMHARDVLAALLIWAMIFPSLFKIRWVPSPLRIRLWIMLSEAYIIRYSGSVWRNFKISFISSSAATCISGSFSNSIWSEFSIRSSFFETVPAGSVSFWISEMFSYGPMQVLIPLRIICIRKAISGVLPVTMRLLWNWRYTPFILSFSKFAYTVWKDLSNP